jgi:NADH dehydrogenase (ubiquinone) Fe-S protein 3
MLLILVRCKSLKKKYFVFLKSILNKYIKKIHSKLNSIYIKTISKHIYPLLFFLKNHTSSQFKSLVDIICYDAPGKRCRFSLAYNLLSLGLNYRLKVIIKVKEKLPVTSTVVPLYASSGWLEREV